MTEGGAWRKRAGAEDGLGLLEFAIILPVLVLLVVGLIDYGNLIREMNTLSLVARDAARVAATHARTARNTTPGEVPVMCENPAVPLSSVDCGGNAAQLQIQAYNPGAASTTPDPIDVAAKKASCVAIRAAGLNPADFNVTPIVVDEAESGSSWVANELRLRIEIKPEARNCVLCWGNILSGVPLRGDSVFVLEDQCRRS